MYIYDEYSIVKGIPHYRFLMNGNLHVSFLKNQRCENCGIGITTEVLEKLDENGQIEIKAIKLTNDTYLRGYHTFTCPKCQAENRFKYEVRLVSPEDSFKYEVWFPSKYKLKKSQGWKGNMKYIKPFLERRRANVYKKG